MSPPVFWIVGDANLGPTPLDPTECEGLIGTVSHREANGVYTDGPCDVFP